MLSSRHKLSSRHIQSFSVQSLIYQSSNAGDQPTKPEGQGQIPLAHPRAQSRRDFLGHVGVAIALSLSAVMLPGNQAKAAKKAAQKLVKYRASPKGNRKCDGCSFYLPDEKACKVVEGAIDPNGWCLRWSKKKS